MDVVNMEAGAHLFIARAYRLRRQDGAVAAALAAHDGPAGGPWHLRGVRRGRHGRVAGLRARVGAGRFARERCQATRRRSRGAGCGERRTDSTITLPLGTRDQGRGATGGRRARAAVGLRGRHGHQGGCRRVRRGRDVDDARRPARLRRRGDGRARRPSAGRRAATHEPAQSGQRSWRRYAPTGAEPKVRRASHHRHGSRRVRARRRGRETPTSTEGCC